MVSRYVPHIHRDTERHMLLLEGDLVVQAVGGAVHIRLDEPKEHLRPVVRYAREAKMAAGAVGRACIRAHVRRMRDVEHVCFEPFRMIPAAQRVRASQRHSQSQRWLSPISYQSARREPLRVTYPNSAAHARSAARSLPRWLCRWVPSKRTAVGLESYQKSARL